MQLGMEVDAGRIRLCLASELLGAGPHSWSGYNHRTWELPSWLLFRLHVGPSGAAEIEQVLSGPEALLAAARPEFKEEMESGRAVAWPWFPRQVERNARTFVEGFQHFWNGSLASQLQDATTCPQGTIAGPLSRISRLGEALDHLKDIVAVRVLPDCYCALRSVSSQTPESERVVYVDPGHETLRLTRFRIHREDHEEWVYLEDYKEIGELGLLHLCGVPLTHAAVESEEALGLGGWLALENELEKMRLDASRPPRLQSAQPEMRRAVESFVQSAEAAGAKVDRVLLRRDLAWPPALGEESGYETVDRYGVPMGAALFGQSHSESAHIIVPGNLYLSVNGSLPEAIALHDDILQTTCTGASFSREIVRGSLNEVNLALLWGIGSGDSAFLPLARMSQSLAGPSYYIAAGITLHRIGWNVYGTLWLGQPEGHALPAERWSLDLGKWSYWTVR